MTRINTFLDVLKKPEDRPISKITPYSNSKQENSAVNNVTNPVFQAARQAGIESIRNTMNTANRCAHCSRTASWRSTAPRRKMSSA